MKKFFWVIEDEDHAWKTANIKCFVSLLYCVNNFNIITGLLQNMISYEYFAQPFFIPKEKKTYLIESSKNPTSESIHASLIIV